eukprot:985042-Prymnesium_polylepis.1
MVYEVEARLDKAHLEDFKAAARALSKFLDHSQISQYHYDGYPFTSLFGVCLSFAAAFAGGDDEAAVEEKLEKKLDAFKDLLLCVRDLSRSLEGFPGGRCPPLLRSCVDAIAKISEVSYGKRGAITVLRKMVDDILGWDRTADTSAQEALDVLENILRESREKKIGCGQVLGDVVKILKALLSGAGSTAE